MAVKVNLLPSDQKVGKDLLKILRVTRMLGVIALGLFIVFGLGAAAFFIFSSMQLNTLNSANSTLKSQISNLEKSEIQITLLKERLGKIKTVLNIPTAVKNLENINSVIAPLTADSTVNELNVTTSKIIASVNFKSTVDLAAFLKGLNGVKTFETVRLSSFSFNPLSGYLVSIVMSEK